MSFRFRLTLDLDATACHSSDELLLLLLRLLARGSDEATEPEASDSAYSDASSSSMVVLRCLRREGARRDALLLPVAVRGGMLE